MAGLGLSTPATPGLGLFERAAEIKREVVPRGIRNNNPLNIEAGGFTERQPGFAGSDGRFARFESMDQGVAAADRLLQSYAGRGLNTIQDIVNRWAPPTENDTGTYAGFVADRLGTEPGAKIDMEDPEVRMAMITAMGEFESGEPVNANRMNGATRPLDEIRASLEGSNEGVPQFRDDPVGAIGTVLQEVGHALEGKGSVIDQLQQRALQRRQIDIQTAGGFLNLLEKGQEIARTVPKDKQESAFALLNRIGGQVMPGFDISTLVGDESTIDLESVIPRFKEMSDESRELIAARVKAMGGDQDALTKVLGDSGFMDTIEEIDDEHNRGSIMDKMRTIQGLVSRAGGDLSEAGLTVADFEEINAKAPEGLRLKPTELRTLRSSPDLQRSAGLTTEEAAAAGEETAARERAKAEFRPAPEPPSGYRYLPNGSLEPIPGGPAERADPPSGYKLKADGTLEPIPGGPAAVKKPPPGYEYQPDGSLLAIPGGPADKTPSSDLIDETGAVKTEATNAIRGTVAQLFGGMFDPISGRMTGLSPDSSLTATSLVAEAESLLKSGEADSVGQAVSIAAPKFDVKLPQPKDVSNGTAGQPSGQSGQQRRLRFNPATGRLE